MVEIADLLEDDFLELLVVPDVCEVARDLQQNVVEGVERHTFLEHHHALHRQQLVRADYCLDFLSAEDVKHAFLEDHVLPEVHRSVELHLERLVEDLVGIAMADRVTSSVRLVLLQLLQSAERVETLVVEVENVNVLRSLQQEHSVLHLNAKLYRLQVHVQLAESLEDLQQQRNK